jgi:hypothetical protein
LDNKRIKFIATRKQAMHLALESKHNENDWYVIQNGQTTTEATVWLLQNPYQWSTAPRDANHIFLSTAGRPNLDTPFRVGDVDLALTSDRGIIVVASQVQVCPCCFDNGQVTTECQCGYQCQLCGKKMLDRHHWHRHQQAHADENKTPLESSVLRSN